MVPFRIIVVRIGLASSVPLDGFDLHCLYNRVFDPEHMKASINGSTVIITLIGSPIFRPQTPHKTKRV